MKATHPWPAKWPCSLGDESGVKGGRSGGPSFTHRQDCCKGSEVSDCGWEVNKQGLDGVKVHSWVEKEVEAGCCCKDGVKMSASEMMTLEWTNVGHFSSCLLPWLCRISSHQSQNQGCYVSLNEQVDCHYRLNTTTISTPTNKFVANL